MKKEISLYKKILLSKITNNQVVLLSLTLLFFLVITTLFFLILIYTPTYVTVFLLLILYLIEVFFYRSFTMSFLSIARSQEITERIGLTWYLLSCWIATVDLNILLLNPYKYPTVHLIYIENATIIAFGFVLICFLLIINIILGIYVITPFTERFSEKFGVKPQSLWNPIWRTSEFRDILLTLPKRLCEKYPKTHCVIWLIETMIFMLVMWLGANEILSILSENFVGNMIIYVIIMWYGLCVLIPSTFGIFCGIQSIYYSINTISGKSAKGGEKH
jgi:hypothetical protein